MVDAKSPTKKAAKPKAPAAHPPVATMVKASVTALKERNGSSLPAIKKYIAANYKVDMVKLNRFVNKSLKNLAEKGELTKVKGSYKLAKAKEEKKPKAKKPAAKKPAAKKATPKKKTAAKWSVCVLREHGGRGKLPIYEVVNSGDRDFRPMFT